jgi:hypothetical protein
VIPFDVRAQSRKRAPGVAEASDGRRPQLAEALAKAKRSKCSIVVAKLAGVARRRLHQRPDCEACSIYRGGLGPDVDRFMLHIYAELAEKERRSIKRANQSCSCTSEGSWRRARQPGARGGEQGGGGRAC